MHRIFPPKSAKIWRSERCCRMWWDLLQSRTWREGPTRSPAPFLDIWDRRAWYPILEHRMLVLLGSNLSWFDKVKQRNAPTLKRLIAKYIRPFTTVETDLWAAYHTVPQMPQQYTHLVVNHSINFVDPQTGANTQTIESKNSQIKSMVRRKYGLRDHPFRGHLREFAWRERFGKRRESFYNFWKHVSLYYPCSG